MRTFSRLSLKQLILLMFICNLLIIMGISLYIWGETYFIKRFGIIIGTIGFLSDMASSLLFIRHIMRFRELEELKGMLLQVFGYTSSYALPDNWQDTLRKKAEKIEEGELKGIRPSGRDFLRKGLALCIEGNYTSAISAFEKATELEPNLAEAFLCKGLVLANLGYYDSAFEALDKAVELFPDDEKIGKIREDIRAKYKKGVD